MKNTYGRKNMKRLITALFATIALTALNINAQANADSELGRIDFVEFITASPSDAKVEVNISKQLLKLATTLVKEESPEVAALIQGLESIRVRVYDITDENRAGFERSVQDISSKLSDEQWEQLARVRDGGANVGIFARILDDDSISGIVVSVAEKKEAVFVNIVGDVALDAIADLGKQLDIPALDILKEIEKTEKGEAHAG
jgi:hypothetical protein